MRFRDFGRWRMLIMFAEARKPLQGMAFIVPLSRNTFVALFILFNSVNGRSRQLRIDTNKTIYYRCFVEFRYLVVR